MQHLQIRFFPDPNKRHISTLGDWDPSCGDPLSVSLVALVYPKPHADSMLHAQAFLLHWHTISRYRTLSTIFCASFLHQ